MDFLDLDLKLAGAGTRCQHGTTTTHVQVYKDWKSAETDITAWDELQQLADYPCIFSGPAYCRTAWRNLLSVAGELRLFTIRQKSDGLLIAVFPMMLYHRRQGPVRYRLLGPLSIEDTDKFYPLIRQGYESRVWRAFVESLKSESWDVFRWKDFPLQMQRGLTAIEQLGTECGRLVRVKTAHSPIIDLRQSEDGFWSKHRKFRKALRKLEKVHGSVRLKIYSEPGIVETGLAEYLAIERRGWKKECHGIGRTPDYLEFYHTLANELADTGQFRIGILTAGEKPVAGEIALVAAQRVYFVHGTYDEQYRDFSPGKISTGLFVMEHLSRGYQHGDCLAGFAHYLSPWSDEESLSADFMLYRTSARGRWLWSAQALNVCAIRCYRWLKHRKTGSH